MNNDRHKLIEDAFIGVFNQYAKEPATMAIHTGLSVTVSGHLITLERDERNKVAKLVVKVIEGHEVTGLENEAIQTAAMLLKRRAERFLGDWTVIGLPPLQRVMGMVG
jgi:hypothetical protein